MVSACSPHPAIKILALLGLPHPLDVSREDGKESREHRIRLRSAGVFRKEVVHDSGALNDQTGNVLQRAREKKSITMVTDK